MAMTGGSRVLAVRLATALVQSAAFYGLYRSVAAEPPVWPATTPTLFLPLALIAAGVPLLVMLDAGRMPARWVAVWAIVAAVLLAAFGVYDKLRGDSTLSEPAEALLPWLPLLPALAGGFFVANVLVLDAVVERRWFPPYARHIDTAWKQALQTLFAAIFTSLFWSVLALGAGLFQIVQLDLFTAVLQQPWFFIPATALSTAVAIHVTDVQPALIRGARSLVLALLSWLLPLLAAILLAFLVTLPVTSLAPLWQTHFATALLLGASAWVIVLINTAYGDGDGWAGSRIKQVAAAVASVELVPLVGLAVAALLLRVGEYGWTVNRILAAAAAVLAGCYAIGYVLAAVMRRTRVLERTNFVGAYLGLLLIALLFSPAADPARLMVANQVARLHSGAVSPQAFDYATLKSDGVRWGAAAMERLMADPSAAIATAAKASQTPNTDAEDDEKQPLTAEQLAERVKVMPAGRPFPTGMLQADFAANGVGRPWCFKRGTVGCTLRYVTLVPDGPEAILLVDSNGARVFAQDPPEHWREMGELSGRTSCESVQKALAGAELSLVPHPMRDIVVNGMTLVFNPLLPVGCP